MPQPDEPTSVVEPAHLVGAGHELTEATVARLLESAPPNTARSWDSRWRAYTVWCAIKGIAPLPCSAQQLADYVQARTGTIAVPAALRERARVTEYAPLGVDSLRAHLGSLIKVMRVQGANPPDPVPARQVIKVLVQETAADPTRERSARRGAPAVAEQTKKMVDVQDLGTGAGLRNRALLLLGYNTGRRGGDLVMLALSDVELIRDPDPERHPLGIEVTFRVSKTTPHGLRRDDVVPVKWVGGKYCTATAVTDWMRYLADRGYRDGPLFPRLDRHGNIGAGSASAAGERNSGAITTRTAAQIVADAAQAVHDLEQQEHVGAEARQLSEPDGAEERARYSGLSLRRGNLADALADPEADADKVGRRAGFAPGSRHVYRRREVTFGWDDDPNAARMTEPDESGRD